MIDVNQDYIETILCLLSQVVGIGNLVQQVGDGSKSFFQDQYHLVSLLPPPLHLDPEDLIVEFLSELGQRVR